MLASSRSHALVITTLAIASTMALTHHRTAARAQNTTQSLKPSTIRVSGAVENPRDWTPEQMKAEFAADFKTVPYTLKGVKGEAQCLPLLILIKAAKIKVNPKQKNHELAFGVVVKGRDGYAACFSYGELQPQIGKRSVWVALDRNGKPLPGAAAPAELLSPDDEKPSRWVHAISSITVIDGA